MRKSFRDLTLTAVLFLSPLSLALGADIALNGVLGNRALLVIDGGKPTWFTSGQVGPGGIRLVSVSGETVVVEAEGKRETLMMGQGARLGGVPRPSGAQSVTLNADNQGHFLTVGMINGISVRFLLDTGASLVSMSSTEAKRLGINYTTGQQGYSNTANGRMLVYRVKIDEIRVGGVILNNVEGSVSTSDMPYVLLGMSFLNRMDMKREGEKMTLTKRF
jgi:aspartyl protease family protein